MHYPARAHAIPGHSETTSSSVQATRAKRNCMLLVQGDAQLLLKREQVHSKRE